jgi:ABC-type Fe3+-siderophore transport system permease subunit
MEPIARANPPKLRVVLVIAALVGLATCHRFLGYLTFVGLIFAELLCRHFCGG